MNWVELQDGCEMPEDGEVCIISDGSEWKIACRIGDKFHPVDEDEYVCMSEVISGATHWCRPMLPNQREE